MADIGKDRFNQEEEDEGRPRKFTVVDKRFEVDEEEAAPAAESSAPTPPTPKAPEGPKEARTIKVSVPPEPTAEATVARVTTGEEILADTEDEAEIDPAEAVAAAGLDPDPLAISNALLFFIEELFTRVLIFMGVTPNPQTGLTVRNLEQAQRGIQVLDVLVKEASRDATPEMQQHLARLVAQLKSAYVQLVTGNAAGVPGGVGGGPLIS